MKINSLTKTRISIVEDNPAIRDNVSRFISLHEEFELIGIYATADSFIRTLSLADPQANIVLLDIGLPGTSGLDAIPLILDKLPELNIIILTTYEEEDVIVKALCSGA